MPITHISKEYLITLLLPMFWNESRCGLVFCITVGILQFQLVHLQQLECK